MKKPSQLDETNGYGRTYPTRRAVDGNTDPNIRHGSCAHPSSSKKNTPAWWKVDLKDTYRLYTVVIYNREASSFRLDGFTLSVGNKSQSDQLEPCGNHIGRVKPSASVTTSCEAVGRYLEFRRTNGTRQPDVAGLCEVVVIGHLYIGK